MSAKENVEKQKYLGKTGLILFIAMMNMFIPLSTDLYLPALPSMSEVWQVPTALTNLTLVAFFFFYAVGTLFWGPMSDKYGRKKILQTGAAIYTAASMTCALSMNVYTAGDLCHGGRILDFYPSVAVGSCLPGQIPGMQRHTAGTACKDSHDGTDAY